MKYVNNRVQWRRTDIRDTQRFKVRSHMCEIREASEHICIFPSCGVQLWWTFIRLGGRWSCRWCIRACVTTLRDAGGTCRRLLLATWKWEWIGSLKCLCFVVLLTGGDPVLATLGVGRQGFWQRVSFMWKWLETQLGGTHLQRPFLFETTHIHFWRWGQNVNGCSQRVWEKGEGSVM